jgi:hypothetical protein
MDTFLALLLSENAKKAAIYGDVLQSKSGEGNP